LQQLDRFFQLLAKEQEYIDELDEIMGKRKEEQKFFKKITDGDINIFQDFEYQVA
jgi:hypothetical protein